MTTMRAIRFSTFGPPSVLSLQDIAKPVPQPGEALVEAAASAINPSDVKFVSGLFNPTLPRTPGRDYAGTVVTASPRWIGKTVWGNGAGFGIGRDELPCRVCRDAGKMALGDAGEPLNGSGSGRWGSLRRGLVGARGRGRNPGRRNGADYRCVRCRRPRCDPDRALEESPRYWRRHQRRSGTRAQTSSSTPGRKTYPPWWRRLPTTTV